MANLPVRNIGKAGLMMDNEPWDEPWEAWSSGTNIRFDDGKAQRAPIFRTFTTAASSTLLSGVGGVISYRPYSGFDVSYFIDQSGRIQQAPVTAATPDASGPGYVPVVGTAQFTTAHLADCLYVNRESGVPRVLTPGATTFVPVPNWPTSYTAQVVRALSSFAVAFNITKGPTQYGNMVKWSDAVSAGAAASAWDPTVTTSLAGENLLSQMDGPILDANNLGAGMLIYSSRQCWAMEPTGDKTFLFNFRKLWEEPRWGVWTRNCALEVEGQHYVFGQGDMYVHDGVSRPQSIASGKIRKFVYSNMIAAQASKFFVCHDPFSTSVLFCFVSQDKDVVFKNPTFCNKAAVYNYLNGTWGLMELPNIGGATLANANYLVPWAGDTKPWALSGGAWLDQADSAKTALLMAGDALGPQLPAPTIYALDPIFRYSRISLPFDPYANSPAYLEHGGISLDLAGMPLQHYKRVRRIDLQARVLAGGPITVSIGASPQSVAAPVYTTSQYVYDPAVTDFIPSSATGRYLALRIDAPANCEFDVTGFDLDVIPGGKR